MNNKLWLGILLGGCCMSIAVWYNFQLSATSSVSYEYLTLIKEGKSLDSLFPTNAADLLTLKENYKKHIELGINAILQIPAAERTFANTIHALDQLSGLSDVAIFSQICAILEMVSTDEHMRSAAHEIQKELQALWIDLFSNNKDLYLVCKNFYQAHQNDELLSDEQKRFMKELVTDFERGGLNLPDEKRADIVGLKKELADLGLQFEKNIAQDNRTVTVDGKDLAGLDAEFIAALQKTDDGKYKLTVDYPVYFNVMEHCAVENTRKRIYEAFSQRGYPANVSILKHIIQKRDALAKLLGYPHYAAYDLADQMVQDATRADKFLSELIKRSQVKEKAELTQLIAELPESVTLAENDKIKPWDLFYLKGMYKKKNHAIDEREIAHYFPVDKTIDRLFAIYRTLFSLDFEKLPSKVWHEEVQLIKVTTADHSKVLGYLFLDLFPRPNKFSHACHSTIIPGVADQSGMRTPTVSAVLANFPKSIADKPALLMHKDVETFFHEFGHALHAVLGATQMAGFSGTSVKRDFVELPSQMLEEWLWDKEILKQVSCHYQTGNAMPDELIDTIIKLKQFDSGIFVQTQAFYARMSLDFFNQGPDIDPYVIMRELYTQYRPHLMFHIDNHMYASFGHLMGYGAKYYGYLWSKVFALDVFEMFKKEGLLNPEIGSRYIAAVIGKGGSKDPNELLRDFLGREPQQEAFVRNLGL